MEYHQKYKMCISIGQNNTIINNFILFSKSVLAYSTTNNNLIFEEKCVKVNKKNLACGQNISYFDGAI